MSTIVEYAFRSDSVVLADALGASDVRLEIERITAADPERPQLFVWVSGEDLDAFDDAVEADPTVTDIHVLSDVDGRRLYSLRLTEQTELVLYPVWAELGGEGLQAHYEDGWWYSRIRFPDRDAFSEYRAFFEENDVEFRVTRLYDTDGSTTPDDGLTDEQRETLKLAYERGYFEVPRKVTMAELAEELGVSNQAISERLRRGYARLVEHVVGVS